MLEVNHGKIVRIIALAREFGPEHPRLHDFIAGLNDDEKANVVALMWVGRDTFDASEFDDALETARAEATAPTEEYLLGIPGLAEHLEAGMDALGIDVTEEEDDIHGH